MHYFTTNFAMVQHHKWSLGEIENMIPWEKETYVVLLQQWVQEEREKIEQQQQQTSRRR